MTRVDSFGLSRRGLLGALATGGAAALAGCQVESGSGYHQEGKNVKDVVIPDYPTKLTDADVTFRWIDSGDLKSVFEKAILSAFTTKHPNIKTNYDGGGWQSVNKVVPLGVRNHNAPDVFAKPQGMPNASLVNQKWVQPLDDIIPDFDTWKAAFPDTAFIPGLHTFNGKTYSWPLSSNRRLSQMCIWDQKNLSAAGYDDPDNQIKTWDDLHAALQKVVKDGKVGLMVGADALSGLISILACTAGWPGVSGRDPKTGKYVWDAPEVMQAYEFMQKIVADKLIVPGFLTLKQSDARSQMPAGKSGLVISGPWDIPRWKQNSPDWKYSMTLTPSPDGSSYTQPFEQTGANNPWVYAGSKLSTAAGQIMAYMGSEEGQKMMVILSEGNLVSLQDKANKAANQTGILDKNAERAASLAEEIMRAAPMVAVRNPDVAEVDLVHKQVEPTWQNLWTGIFSGQIKNVPAELKKYSEQSEQALDTAIATAKKKGSSITRDSYAFPNWDPSKDYTLADYKELPDYKG